MFGTLRLLFRLVDLKNVMRLHDRCLDLHLDDMTSTTTTTLTTTSFMSDDSALHALDARHTGARVRIDTTTTR